MKAKASNYEKQLIEEIRKTPEECLPNLLQIVRIFRESVTIKPAGGSLKKGCRVKEGKTRPVDDPWEDVDAG